MELPASTLVSMEEYRAKAGVALMLSGMAQCFLMQWWCAIAGGL